MDVPGLIDRLKTMGDPEALAGMARYNIRSDRSFGVSIPKLRKLGKELGRDHELAARLWAAGIRETMILAALVDDPDLITEEQMEAWVLDFYDWEVCDQCCMNLFEKTPYAAPKAVAWSARPEEFVKRAGFVLMARLAVSDKKAPDQVFEAFLPLIVREATDDRNLVKKEVNWALRQIGKRNLALNARAVTTARRIQKTDQRAARWIAKDALAELTGPAVLERLRAKEKSKDRPES